MKLRVATVAADPASEARVATDIATLRDVELVMRCVDRVELLAVLSAGSVDAIVSVGIPEWLDRSVLEACHPHETRFVGLTFDAIQAQLVGELGGTALPGNTPIETIVRVCTHGPVLSAVATSFSGSEGRIVAVWGPKGAPGRTTIAIELAAALAASEPETILVDADPFGGDILQLLGVIEEVPSIVWAAHLAAHGSLDVEALAGELRRVGSAGPVLLPGLPNPGMWQRVSLAGWSRTLAALKANFRHVVVDIGFCVESNEDTILAARDVRHALALEVLDQSDRVVAVTRPDPVGIKNFIDAFGDHQALSGDGTAIVANRVSDRTGADAGDVIHRHTGRNLRHHIPDRPREAATARLRGQPIWDLAPDSPICESIRGLVATLGGRTRPRGVLTRLVGRA